MWPRWSWDRTRRCRGTWTRRCSSIPRRRSTTACATCCAAGRRPPPTSSTWVTGSCRPPTRSTRWPWSRRSTASDGRRRGSSRRGVSRVPATGPLTGVVLLNMGGPDTLSAVRPFLARLFSDRELIRLPAAFLAQPLFAWIVSGLRARKVRRYYEEIGGGSPIVTLTERQRRALEEALLATGGNFKVYVGMRYWHPLSKHAALEMKEDGVSRAIALPLYPQYCRATSGSSLNDLRRWLSWAGCTFPVSEIRSYPVHPKYVAALAGTVQSTIEGADRGGMFLLFSAHGIPKALIDAGDPYQAETERTVAGVMRRFPGIPHGISYQSRA